MTFEFLRKISEIYSNIKFHENPSSGIQVVPDRHVEADIGFSQFGECTYY
jgi:hypothetical protein